MFYIQFLKLLNYLSIADCYFGESYYKQDVDTHIQQKRTNLVLDMFDLNINHRKKYPRKSNVSLQPNVNLLSCRSEAFPFNKICEIFVSRCRKHRSGITVKSMYNAKQNVPGFLNRKTEMRSTCSSRQIRLQSLHLWILLSFYFFI